MKEINFILEKVEKNKENILKNLLEYYLYDFNMFYEDDLNENGKFEFVNTSDYILKNNYEAFFIKVKNNYAGFILINNNTRFANQPATKIEEFWIMPKYRKGLFAFKVLKYIFSMYIGEKEFIILKDNKRWFKVFDYWLNKNYKVIKKENIIKWENVEFALYVIS